MDNEPNKQSKRLDDEAQTTQQVALRSGLAKVPPLIVDLWAAGVTAPEIAQAVQISASDAYRYIKILEKAILERVLEESEIFQSLDQARERYAELIDKKFSASLSLDEQADLFWLEEVIDEAEALLYDETIKQLKEIRDRLSSDPSRQSGGSD
jgi:hypothetical protein